MSINSTISQFSTNPSKFTQYCDGLVKDKIKTEIQFIYSRKSRQHYRKFNRLNGHEIWSSHTDPSFAVKGVPCILTFGVSFNLHEYCCSVNLSVNIYKCEITQPKHPNTRIVFYGDSFESLIRKINNNVVVVDGMLESRHNLQKITTEREMCADLSQMLAN